MKILLCHNYYQQPGGEDQVFADEGVLLESRGHKVIRFTTHNDAVQNMGRFELLHKTLWNGRQAEELRKFIRRERPELMHCTNIFPLISPAAYYVAKQEHVAVVQTLHNYRSICPKAQFLRNGKVCESCLGKAIPWPAVVHSCYRDSRSATAAVAAMLTFHRAKKTWTRMVDRFIALTDFSKQKHVEGGLPSEKIVVKPNFVHPDPGLGKGSGDYAVFVGRLSPEKGIATLLQSWSRLKLDLPLKIVGDGPMAGEVRRAAATDRRIHWLGRRALSEVCDIVGESRCLIMPSVWYETFGRTIIEAYAKGTPVVVSRLGAMQELVADGRTGLLFEPGNADDLARKVQSLLGKEPPALQQIRRQARREYETKYTPKTNYEQLMSVYQSALVEARRASSQPVREHAGVA